jgi:topoisomerase-4 subunit A
MIRTKIVDERGELLGEFRPNDKILIIQQSGEVITPELSTHFDSDMVVLENGFLKANFSYLL